MRSSTVPALLMGLSGALALSLPLQAPLALKKPSKKVMLSDLKESTWETTQAATMASAAWAHEKISPEVVLSN
ncbi:hypothetical protein F4779DRAFT_621359 [Xylariaceae sp. FL0662B]|nr:hypothetical protein F4779DRAFT_621359 [Xylariaceae sp. FL0662B]